jgi:hypothetical protein
MRTPAETNTPRRLQALSGEAEVMSATAASARIIRVR